MRNLFLLLCCTFLLTACATSTTTKSIAQNKSELALAKGHFLLWQSEFLGKYYQHSGLPKKHQEALGDDLKIFNFKNVQTNLTPVDGYAHLTALSVKYSKNCLVLFYLNKDRKVISIYPLQDKCLIKSKNQSKETKATAYAAGFVNFREILMNNTKSQKLLMDNATIVLDSMKKILLSVQKSQNLKKALDTASGTEAKKIQEQMIDTEGSIKKQMLKDLEKMSGKFYPVSEIFTFALLELKDIVKDSRKTTLEINKELQERVNLKFK